MLSQKILLKGKVDASISRILTIASNSQVPLLTLAYVSETGLLVNRRTYVNSNADWA